MLEELVLQNPRTCVKAHLFVISRMKSHLPIKTLKHRNYPGTRANTSTLKEPRASASER